jgi:hypothetical protein
MLARQVVVNRVEVQRFEFSVRTFSALDPGFLTNIRDPLVLAGDGIAGAATGTLPGNRIYILSAAKELPEQFDFLVGG